MSDLPGLRALYAELAESVLTLEERGLTEEMPGRDSASQHGESIRGMLLAEVSRHRRGALATAYANYQREVSRMRTQNYQLPPSPEGRRALLAHLFETYPQMERTFLTVQHREFAALSDGDVESFLKQLQELGAYAPKDIEKGTAAKGAKWSSPEIQEQMPETD